MKTKFYFLIALIFSATLQSHAQYVDTSSCIYSPGFILPYIDSSYQACDTTSSNFQINIEPTLDNIWIKNKTFKFGNMDIRDTTCALFTDSNVSYPINNMSAFYFQLPQIPSISSSLIGYYVKFWHKFETDTLMDGCWLEFSTDSGVTWNPIDSFQNYSLSTVYQYCNLYGYDGFLGGSFDTLLNGRKAWSGSSQGWQYTALHLNFIIPFKHVRNNPINALRFVFNSDSIQGGKAGWIISDFSFGHTSFVGATENRSKENALTFYPNPSSTGIFNLKLEDVNLKGRIQVYNLQGQMILETDLHSDIDLSTFSNGLYVYVAVIDGQRLRGFLNKQ